MVVTKAGFNPEGVEQNGDRLTEGGRLASRCLAHSGTRSSVFGETEDLALRLFNAQDLIGGHAGEILHDTARPTELDVSGLFSA